MAKIRRRARRPPLLVLPLGRALFDEGARALDAIGAAEDHAERLLLETQARVLFHRECGSQGGFCLADRDGGFACDLLGQLARRFGKLARRDDLVGESQFQRRLRVEHVTGHDQLARLVVPDSMRQALSAAESGDEPKVYLGLPEARFVAGDDQIAGERQFEAAAECEAVDGRDDGNRQVLETFHHAMAEAREIEAVDRRHFRHRRDIRARDEGLVAGSRDYKHAHRRVVPHLANDARYFLEHLAIERVQRIGPVHGERRNRSFIENYIFKIHTSNSAPRAFNVNPSRGSLRRLRRKSPCANNLTVPHKSRAHAAAFIALAIVIVIGAARISRAQESTPAHKPARAIFVANPTANSLSVFPDASKGNVPSLFSRTFLGQPTGITYWKGNLYVTNIGGPGGYSVRAYPVSGGRRPAPLFTIGGKQLIAPQGVALDSAGNIYVVNEGIESGDQSSDPPSITIYRAGSKGHDAPMARIRGPKTGLKNSQAIALDSHGYIYVSNQGENGEPDSITVYSPGSKGNVAPARIISGSATLLSAPEGVAVDSNGRLFVSSGAAG